ncbi:hypothetical protein GALMADRAFT_253923 [Galerina marginata CBS 339.88]|uniref:Uncharacterized protein n=1 Tax=Galerina marginata (strain CBS 339.88) TaxID=685588 RepID=A0A067SL07_GALM3|nr:hypothetical protein GALMADRAFT_253923 [Galerina marginata CBS 339.88]
MVDIHDIPPEILATAFELGIYSEGISFLRPLAKVCRSWREIIDHTPRLWGIILIRKRTSSKALERQIAKAKASPLSITISPGTSVGRYKNPIAQLTKLSSNWVIADIGTQFISPCLWVDLHRSLEELSLSRDAPAYDDPGPFFEGVDTLTKRETKLRSFTATGLSRSWVLGFLGPSIRHFGLIRGLNNVIEPGNYMAIRNRCRISDTWDYLARVPEATSIELKDLRHTHPHSLTPPHVHLLKLRNLKATSVLHLSSVLASVAAPSLQTLSVNQNPPNIEQAWSWNNARRYSLPMAPLFTQWSAPGFVPTHLHTLELLNCLEVGDVPYFIRWLERLPNLVRLFVEDEADAFGRAANNGEANFYNALASPLTADDGHTSWLCPSLMILYLIADHEISDLIAIARARGGIIPTAYDIPPPNRLRRLEAHLCATSEADDVDYIRSVIDNAYCICTNCGLNV